MTDTNSEVNDKINDMLIENNNNSDTNSTCNINSIESATINSNDIEELYQLDDNDHKDKSMSLNQCPATICTSNTIGLLRSRKLLKVLLDSGSSSCLIKRSALPQGIIPKELNTPKKFTKLAGKLLAHSVVTLRDIRLPEFDKNRHVDQQRALIFDNDKCKYDVIFGTNFLSKVGIKLDYETGEMTWFDNVLPMRPSTGLTSTDFAVMEDHYHIQLEDDLLGDDWLDCYATEILDAKYEWTNIENIVKGLEHLSSSQQNDLLGILKKHATIFDGSLGLYPHKKFHIDIDPDAKPKHSRPYSIPRIHLSTFKKELEHLV